MAEACSATGFTFLCCVQLLAGCCRIPPMILALFCFARPLPFGSVSYPLARPSHTVQDYTASSQEVGVGYPMHGVTGFWQGMRLLSGFGALYLVGHIQISILSGTEGFCGSGAPYEAQYSGCGRHSPTVSRVPPSSSACLCVGGGGGGGSRKAAGNDIAPCKFAMDKD
ncbi:hypothetical protein C8T65DRAFT_698306 [Cerioporus squamosus]|nr:hypothetical protein C8T65DRAFT_698306 [Cerioporus squamosus]